MADSALVLFSGGQDSTTCLAWALSQFDCVETIGFRYGQRHEIELQCRQPIRSVVAGLCPAWAGKLGKDHLIDLDVLGKVSVSALTADLPFWRLLRRSLRHTHSAPPQ
jgi:7-cyano-7-deazaguanine synthase